jgi:hypothetical protein
MTVQVDGEAYGAHNRQERFTIAFMDMEGNIYGESEHPFSLFTNEPKWVDIKITPTELPPEFWVLVNFKPSRDKGVYIGYVESGGHSGLTDEYGNFVEMEEQFDWCITLKVRDEVKGKTLAYDPSAFKERRTPEGEVVPKKVEFYEEASEQVKLRYKGLEKTWAKSMVRLLDTGIAGLGELYGLERDEPLAVKVEVNPEAEKSELRILEDGSLEWLIVSKNELLPVTRGGKERHVLNFCRGLMQLALRDYLELAEYGPEGQEEGICTYLASRVVSYIFVACGKELWPVAYNFHLEEGPKYVSTWIEEDLQDPARRIAAILRAVHEKLGDEPFYALMQEVFRVPVAARDWIRILHDKLAESRTSEADAAWLGETFPDDLLNPPILWFDGKPDFTNPAIFAGLKGRRFKTQIFLSYDDGSAESSAHLTEEVHLLRVMIPPGTWRLADLKVYCRRNGDSKEGQVKVEILDGELASLGHTLVPLSKVAPKKMKWQSLGPRLKVELSAPFYLAIRTESAGAANLEIGLDENSEICHSAVYLPGSHVTNAPGKGDWMIRLYLEPVPALDKDGLDDRLKTLRKQVK